MSGEETRKEYGKLISDSKVFRKPYSYRQNINMKSSKFKSFANSLLEKTIMHLSKLRERLQTSDEVKKITDYEDLTASSDANDDQTYADVLLDALQNENIKNIAVTGPYGSGKSTILKTFEKTTLNMTI